jgi:hypothetical protein
MLASCIFSFSSATGQTEPTSGGSLTTITARFLLAKLIGDRETLPRSRLSRSASMSSSNNVIRISGREALETRCAQCGAQPKLVHRMLDPRKGQTLRMYKCSCGEQIWTTRSE